MASTTSFCSFSSSFFFAEIEAMRGLSYPSSTSTMTSRPRNDPGTKQENPSGSVSWYALRASSPIAFARRPNFHAVFALMNSLIFAVLSSVTNSTIAPDHFDVVTSGEYDATFIRCVPTSAFGMSLVFVDSASGLNCMIFFLSDHLIE